MTMNYVEMFHALHPGFFEKPWISSLPREHVFDEQVLWLADYVPVADVACPPHITFGMYQGDLATLHEAVRAVDEDWVQYFSKGDRVFCAFDGEKVASFCLLDEFGEYQGMRIAGPGCVGTVPEYRRQGIGLRMVQLGTMLLKDDGYDASYIHYTAVGHWYARLGYKTVIQWNCKGIL